MPHLENEKDVKNTIAYRHGAQSQEEIAASQKKLNNKDTDKTTNYGNQFDQIANDALEKVEHYKKTGKLLSHQASGITKLAKTEASLSLSASAKLFKLFALFAPIAFIFYISLCMSIGIISYELSQSVIFSVSTFLSFQLILIFIIIITVKKTKSYIGFSKTKKHIKGLKNELTHLF